MSLTFAIAGVAAIAALCGLSYWIGRKAQAAEDFDALASAFRPDPATADAESEHWGGA